MCYINARAFWLSCFRPKNSNQRKKIHFSFDALFVRCFAVSRFFLFVRPVLLLLCNMWVAKFFCIMDVQMFFLFRISLFSSKQFGSFFFFSRLSSFRFFCANLKWKKKKTENEKKMKITRSTYETDDNNWILFLLRFPPVW